MKKKKNVSDSDSISLSDSDEEDEKEEESAILLKSSKKVKNVNPNLNPNPGIIESRKIEDNKSFFEKISENIPSVNEILSYKTNKELNVLDRSAIIDLYLDLFIFFIFFNHRRLGYFYLISFVLVALYLIFYVIYYTFFFIFHCSLFLNKIFIFAKLYLKYEKSVSSTIITVHGKIFIHSLIFNFSFYFLYIFFNKDLLILNWLIKKCMFGIKLNQF